MSLPVRPLRIVAWVPVPERAVPPAPLGRKVGVKFRVWLAGLEIQASVRWWLPPAPSRSSRGR